MRFQEFQKHTRENCIRMGERRKRIFLFFFFKKKVLQVKGTKQHHKHTRKHSRCLISGWVCVSDCFPCVAPGRGLSKSSFHKCQDQATAVTAWHPPRWFGGGEGMDGVCVCVGGVVFKTKKAKQRKTKIEDVEWRGDSAFVHLKENEKGKKF